MTGAPDLDPDKLRDSARQLRRSMTPSEKVRWERLRFQRLNGFRFRRQHPAGLFILDFACVSIRLGVELDGWIHDEAATYDQRRDAFLAERGWTMIRFRNEDIVFRLEEVEARIGETAARLAERRIDGGGFG